VVKIRKPFSIGGMNQDRFIIDVKFVMTGYLMVLIMVRG